MNPLLHLLAGLAPALSGWWLLRRIAGAGGPLAARLLDLAPVLIGWSALVAATARPGFAGAVILALAGGLGIADRTKRAVLREPIVFSDMAELSQVFTNPELYLPFAPRGLLYGGGAALLLGAAALLPLEPGLWAFRPWPGLLALALLLGLICTLAFPPVLPRAAEWLRRLKPSGDPLADTARLGPLASLLVYGMIARAERGWRREQAALAHPTVLRRPAHRPPVVVVQSESFFDARRLHPGIAADLLPGFDRLRQGAEAQGLLEVPGWGANTMRTEFAVLSGLADAALGFDRFNPYHAFARRPVPSLAAKFRARGYRTVCVHPYARRFYRRDLILPGLGFDAFVAIEAFPAAERANGFVTDGALCDHLLALLEAEPEGLFLFAMTMENHGPWLSDPAGPAGRSFAPGLPAEPHLVQLRRYLAGLLSADRMLTRLADALANHSEAALLAFYGDHLPSLPTAFDACGFSDPRSDYLLWRPEGGYGSRRDLPAHALHELILAPAPARQAARALG